jgi:hypothetical protein
MKRRLSPAKELSLARKRALIRSLIEQAALNGTPISPASGVAVGASAVSAAVIIPFPAQGK